MTSRNLEYYFPKKALLFKRGWLCVHSTLGKFGLRKMQQVLFSVLGVIYLFI